MSLTKIRAVDPGSPAQRAGVLAGETLVQVNGHPVNDVLDYKYFTYDPRLELTLAGEDGRRRTLRVRKGEGEELGLNFETYLMDRARSCANRCIFCFVDQMPPGMRESLYFKDDDARLSFLMGNYITLTNLSRREIQRIQDLRISPINISVHATNPQVREQLLRNPRAGECLDIMRDFAQAGIVMNCQVVSCPGINDGAELERTLSDLSGLYPQVKSVAVVPVGVTRFREGLYPLQTYTPATASQLIDQVEAFAAECRERLGSSFVWCSDEFYLKAGRTLPDEEAYEEFTQLENGVGMLRLLEAEFCAALLAVEPEERPQPFAIATGMAAARWLEGLLQRAKACCPALDGRVYGIENRFFGPDVDVAGLVTGEDLIGQLRGRALGDRLLIPDSMLRHGEQVFLDDMTVSQAEQALGVPLIPVAQDGGALVDAIFGPGEDTGGCVWVEEPETEYFRYNPPRPPRG